MHFCVILFGDVWAIGSIYVRQIVRFLMMLSVMLRRLFGDLTCFLLLLFGDVSAMGSVIASCFLSVCL